MADKIIQTILKIKEKTLENKISWTLNGYRGDRISAEIEDMNIHITKTHEAGYTFMVNNDDGEAIVYRRFYPMTEKERKDDANEGFKALHELFNLTYLQDTSEGLNELIGALDSL